MHTYEDGLQPCNANYTPLTPVEFLVRASEVYGDKNKKATEEAFAGGWLLKDRSKDIVISGGKTFPASRLRTRSTSILRYQWSLSWQSRIRSGVRFLARLLNSDPAWNDQFAL